MLVPELPEPGGRVVLSEDESHYVARVCRAREGDRIQATDGRGALATLALGSIGRAVEAEVESRDVESRAQRAWVWCGAPEGDRADWLVEKLAELGVEAWQPVATERGPWKWGDRAGDRWRRLAVAGLRQSRRRFLLEVREPAPLESLLETLPPSTRWLGEPSGAKPPEHSGLGLAVGMIGPAGGLTDLERRRLEGQGFAPLRLSDGRLRTETAALAWASWWSVAR